MKMNRVNASFLLKNRYYRQNCQDCTEESKHIFSCEVELMPKQKNFSKILVNVLKNIVGYNESKKFEEVAMKEK